VKKLILFVSSLLLVGSGFAATKPATVKQPPAKSLAQEVKELKAEVDELKAAAPGRNDYGFVMTSPYVGIRATYDPNDLIVNLPSVNEDVRLLEQRQELADYADKHNFKIPERPIIDLSGTVEGQVWSKRDYTQGSKSDIDLSRAELDVIGDISRWVTGVMILSYDSNKITDTPRYSNSKFYVNRGFITIGNLNEFPMYGSLGQFYVPFGQYTNYMVTTPLTQSLARTKERAVVFGYDKDKLYGAVYAYKGDTYTGDRNNVINNWGINLGYKIAIYDFGFSFGAGYISNLADSEVMQDTNGGTFTGFKSGESLDHFVSAVNLHGEAKYTDYSVVAEYVGAVRRFDQVSDMSFNNRGARPQALDIEGNYNFKFMDKPTSFSLGYGRTWDALALSLPQHSAFIKLGTAWFKSTIESIEYRQDWNYSKTDTASGNGVTVTANGAKTRNIITAQVGVYF